MHFNFAVIGNGLLGSAILDEISKDHSSVVGYGANYGTAGRYFSSHEDDSRLVRTYHDDHYWEDLAIRNLQEIRALEKEVEMKVFYDLPVYYNRKDNQDALLYASLQPIDEQHSARVRPLFNAEDIEGGFLDPKRYIKAMNRRSIRRSINIYPTAVTSVTQDREVYQLIPLTGQSASTDIVIDTRGAFSEEAFKQGKITIVGKVLIYTTAPLDVEEGSFCFIDSSPKQNVFQNAYGFFQYQKLENTAISKFGFTELHYEELASIDKLIWWFQGGYTEYSYLQEALLYIEEFMGGSHKLLSVKPCALSLTSNGKPFVERKGNYITITGGNGNLAKCSQAFAQEALHLVGL
ncbi:MULTISPECIES: FAD-dependent oxidoreductase [unclassified Moorena]|uniref:FAD-dependent oxidoreductase n=1 Tax=unclassified Moorena TaxID=2683338 RepID=UPI0013BABA6F|nr:MULTISPECIES: FAD-dependent oxidoreductase [unclassified Moorena]NEP33342.1 FAD-binding oxidoreductase [Moorena sp. SIO3B2]NER89470.1 FAD-binding oxidoreductase [Moorena sp. SIO3A2]NET67815.1 FAD-binding oxidoreductase [Moorena sp. SIO1G6]